MVVINGQKFRLVPEPDGQKTVAQLVEELRPPGNQAVIARSGQRGQLTGALKREGISTRQRRLDDGTYLFTRCKPREFKP
jgi:hypothetical protein